MRTKDSMKTKDFYVPPEENDGFRALCGEAHLREICFDICYPGIVTPSAMREIREMLGRMVRQCRLNHEIR